jgi:hypothetical protein
MNQQLLQIFLDRFANRSDVYAKQWWSETEYGYVPVWENVTIDHLRAHIAGSITLGWYAVGLDSTGKWLCIDSDNANGKLAILAKHFSKHGWRIVPEGQRPGRDGHIWIFFDQPVPSRVLRQFAKTFIRSAGFSETEFEIFPKQDEIKTGKLGNLARSPLGVHHKPGADLVRGLFDGVAANLDSQLEWFASQQPNQASSLLSFVDDLERLDFLQKTSQVSKRKGSKGSTGSRIDWLEYAQSQGFKQDGRYWRGPCPSCKATGLDSDNNHMWVAENGAAGCWRCSLNEILEAVRRAS